MVSEAVMSELERDAVKISVKQAVVTCAVLDSCPHSLTSLPPHPHLILVMSTEGEELNPYELLEVGLEASEPEIKTAYRQRSLKVHPDRVSILCWTAS